MATVYFVRDGRGKNRAKSVIETSKSQPLATFERYKTTFSPVFPYFNDTTPLEDFTKYRYVVIEITKEDISPKFSVPGFYIIHNLSPDEYTILISDK